MTQKGDTQELQRELLRAYFGLMSPEEEQELDDFAEAMLNKEKARIAKEEDDGR